MQSQLLEIIVTNSGGAIIPGFENNPILMNEEQTILLAQTARTQKLSPFIWKV
jgi:hypothetical protein